MKKNEKGFMQEEKNLEKVAGGAMASGVEVETSVKTGDISLVNVNTNKTDNSTRDSNNPTVTFGNVENMGGFSFKNS